MCTAVATAHDFEVDGIYYNITDATNKTVRVTFRGYDSESYSNEYTGSVVIPESVIYDGSTYSVTSIGYSAFSECSGLTSVVIGNSVTSIGNCAFYGCSGLTSIEIPNSVTSIGGSAFYKCTGLTSVVIGKSVTSIGGDAFSYCSGLTSVEFNAENCTSMGSSSFPVFRCCEALFTITIGEKVKNIPGCAFYYCSRLKSIKIPNSVTSIGGYAFRYCSGLTSIEIPNSVTSIGGSAFNKCSGLTSVVIGNSVTSIGDGAFSECSGLTSVVIGNSVTSIGNLAFSDCTGLTSVVIPNSVTSIGGAAFKGCTGLTSIEIPSSVKSIGNTAFGSCENLKEVHINDIAAWCNISFGISAANPLCYAENLYLNGELMKELVIPEGITSIGSYAFVQYTGLTSIEIPNSVTSIGGAAFKGCTGLTSVVIGDGVTSIGEAAFCYCSGLTSVVIGDGVTSIGKTAFYGCTGLTSIEIPNSVTSIGEKAFSGYTGLTSVVIGKSVTSIGGDAFSGCYRLTSITSLIPADALFAVDSYMFYNVDKYACTLYVPAGAKEVYASTAGWDEFANIVELEPTEVTITVNQYGAGTYCSPYALDFSNVDGLKAYAATGYKSNSQVVTLTRVQTSEAGIGLFLKGEPGEYVVPVIESTDEHSLNMLVGTLEPTIVNSTAGAMSNYKFTIAEGDAYPMFYPFEDGTTLSAGKAYLQIPTAWLPSTAQKSLNIRFDEGETTDIDEVNGEEENVKNIYDLQGRVVENPTSGIYIINGKKVIIK